MTAFYNDNCPFVCQWTRNLMGAGLITQGTVDERSIEELKPADLAGYERVHLFSGIAGWEAALKLAGWRGPVWSASLPCPAFSCAGKSEGFADPRGQIWIPVLRLIREHRPRVIVGEQVPAAIRHGWLDRVFTDLEKEGYACGSCVLGAHSAGAPHIRQRIFWLAKSTGEQIWGTGQPRERADQRLEYTASNGREPRRAEPIGRGIAGRCDVDGMDNTESNGRKVRKQLHADDGRQGFGEGCVVGVALGDANQPGSQGRRIDAGEHAYQQSAWSPSQLIQCADGKARRIPAEPAFQPLVANGNGTGNRMGVLRASGNGLAIPTAAQFIRALMECV